MEENLKEVYFCKYCGSCKYAELDSSEDPCDSCLSNPAKENSHKPLYYKEMTKNGKSGC